MVGEGAAYNDTVAEVAESLLSLCSIDGAFPRTEDTAVHDFFKAGDFFFHF